MEISIVELLGLVRDVWSRKLRERTGYTAHRRNLKPEIRWTSYVDCNKAWKLGRADEFDALPRADERDVRKFDV